MKYFFILGNNPTLSIAEISAIFKINKNSILKAKYLITELKEFDEQKMIRKLGGTIKIGKIISESNPDKHAIQKKLEEYLKNKNFQNKKIKFGISIYNKSKINQKAIGMELKKRLKEKSMSCRMVTGKEKALSSVIVEQNKLITNGAEFNLFIENNKVYIGATEAVQPFKELSFRDYGRPGRDDQSGMLPPKLAQIMINLSQAPIDATLLDSFCGSGTVLTEALVMGYKKIIGVDISHKAITDTGLNINWIAEKWKIKEFTHNLYVESSTNLTKIIKPNSISAIITEPYLGPQRGKINIQRVKQELEDLYGQTIKEYEKIINKDGRIIMLWPVFKVTGKSEFINPQTNGLKIIKPIPDFLANNKVIFKTKRNTVIYGREGQRVWREIVILAKKSS